MTQLIDIRSKLASDVIVRLGNDVRALGDFRAVDVRDAKLVYDSTGEPLDSVSALTTLIGLLTLIRDETAALGPREAVSA